MITARYSFDVKMGNPRDAETAKNGTKLLRGANFRACFREYRQREA